MQKPEDKMDVHPVIQEDCDNNENATVSTDDQDVNANISVDSQSSGQTTTLSDPSRKLPEDSGDEMNVKTFNEKEIQTDETYVLICKVEYEKLLQRLHTVLTFKGTSMK